MDMLARFVSRGILPEGNRANPVLHSVKKKYIFFYSGLRSRTRYFVYRREYGYALLLFFF